jgi:Uma2 family endonuclease
MNKVIKNILHCLKHGTQMGWLIDPEEQSIFVYQTRQEPEVFDRPETQLSVPSFVSDLELKVRDLFAWLLE